MPGRGSLADRGADLVQHIVGIAEDRGVELVEPVQWVGIRLQVRDDLRVRPRAEHRKQDRASSHAMRRAGEWVFASVPPPSGEYVITPSPRSRAKGRSSRSASRSRTLWSTWIAASGAQPRRSAIAAPVAQRMASGSTSS